MKNKMCYFSKKFANQHYEISDSIACIYGKPNEANIFNKQTCIVFYVFITVDLINNQELIATVIFIRKSITHIQFEFWASYVKIVGRFIQAKLSIISI